MNMYHDYRRDNPNAEKLTSLRDLQTQSRGPKAPRTPEGYFVLYRSSPHDAWMPFARVPGAMEGVGLMLALSLSKYPETSLVAAETLPADELDFYETGSVRACADCGDGHPCDYHAELHAR